MAKVHGSKGLIYVDDQSATCQNLSGDTTAVTTNRSKNNPDSTTFGENTMQRIDGLRDFTMDVTTVWNSGASTTIGVLDEMYSGSLVSRVQYMPGGCATGCPIYTASMRLSSYTSNQPVDGITTANYSLAIASGSLTSACIT